MHVAPGQPMGHFFPRVQMGMYVLYEIVSDVKGKGLHKPSPRPPPTHVSHTQIPDNNEEILASARLDLKAKNAV